MPGKRKTWGFEDCMYLLSDSSRRTQRVGGYMGNRLFRRRPVLLLSVIVVMRLCVWVWGIEGLGLRVFVCGLSVSGFVRVRLCLRASVYLCYYVCVFLRFACPCVVIVLMRLCVWV